MRAAPLMRRMSLVRRMSTLSADPEHLTLGFIGLGLMGTEMARVLSRDGHHHVVLWNRTEDRAFELMGEGLPVSVASTPREVVEKADVTFSMLPTPAASAAVFDGDDGVLAGVCEGKTIVDCATLREEDMISMAEHVEHAGGAFLEAPVAGSTGPAKAGELVFLAGGLLEDYERALPHFELMGKSAKLCGDVGAGTRTKLILNSGMATMLAALAEMLALAEGADVDSAQLLEVISESAIAMPMAALKGPKVMMMLVLPGCSRCFRSC